MSEAPPRSPTPGGAPPPPPARPPGAGAPSASARPGEVRWVALKRWDVWSVGKVQGVLMAAMGIIIGLIYGVIFVIMGLAQGEPTLALAGMGFLVGAPVAYGVIGLLGGALFAWLYGIVADWVGPIRWEMELE